MDEPHTPLTVRKRRLARAWAYRNGALWALGNGLVSSSLVIWLAKGLGVLWVGLSVSLIRAVPQLAGVLQLAAPALIGRLADRKRFCLGAFAASGLTLLLVPLTAVPKLLPSAGAAMVLMIALWGVYHLLQYLATVALWSWLADLVPQPRAWAVHRPARAMDGWRSSRGSAGQRPV